MQNRTPAFLTSVNKPLDEERPLSSQKPALSSVPLPTSRKKSFATDPPAMPTSRLKEFAAAWLDDCEYRQHSSRTIDFRRDAMDKFHWWLEMEGCEHIGTREVQRFITYISTAHRRPEGRWGNAGGTASQRTFAMRPVSRSTIHRYYRELRSFFNYLLHWEMIEFSPVQRLEAPENRPQQIQPFTDDEIRALLAAARRSTSPVRDEAILWLLLDTGLRASELCNLRRKDVQLLTKPNKVTVTGKGDKVRSVPFGMVARRALWAYYRAHEGRDNEPLFHSNRGSYNGAPLTRRGLLRLFERLAPVAHINRKRCSPHTMRHSFAISFLRNGGNVFTLKELLGHESLRTTEHYIALASADMEKQHRQFSPGDRLGK